jgi:hypothetical protein
MIPEPVYYELGDALEDGHTHLFHRVGNSFVTAQAKDEEEHWTHTHTIGVMGDQVFCGISQGMHSSHVHYKVRMVRPIE